MYSNVWTALWHLWIMVTGWSHHTEGTCASWHWKWPAFRDNDRAPRSERGDSLTSLQWCILAPSYNKINGHPRRRKWIYHSHSTGWMYFNIYRNDRITINLGMIWAHCSITVLPFVRAESNILQRFRIWNIHIKIFWTWPSLSEQEPCNDIICLVVTVLLFPTRV